MSENDRFFAQADVLLLAHRRRSLGRHEVNWVGADRLTMGQPGMNECSVGQQPASDQMNLVGSFTRVLRNFVARKQLVYECQVNCTNRKNINGNS